MRTTVLAIFACTLIGTACGKNSSSSESPASENDLVDTSYEPIETTDLPQPNLTGEMSLEQALSQRASIRTYFDTQLTIDEISQLLWAAQGITHDEKRRTAPSAGAGYPVELYLVTSDGLYHYVPDGHRLELLREENLVQSLGSTAPNSFLVDAPAIFVVTVVYERLEERYGERAERYAQLESGHVSQNILLQSVALNLGATTVGAFDDEQVQSVLQTPSNHAPLYLITVGHPAQ